MTQKHHITYDPEWIVPLNGWQHKVITHTQQLKPTEQNYRNTLNFFHALVHELDRLAYRLYEARKDNINP